MSRLKPVRLSNDLDDIRSVRAADWPEQTSLHSTAHSGIGYIKSLVVSNIMRSRSSFDRQWCSLVHYTR
jgi:hypothetical protein